MADVGARGQFLLGGHLREALYFSRTSIARVKIRTVAMNVPISPIATTSLYAVSANHNRRTMSTSLTASALKAVYSASPADFDLPRAANTAKARPAMIPIDPPSAAEIAPCIPASQADSRLAAAVHKTCSPIIGRNIRHTPNSSCKTAEFYRERDMPVKPARPKMARIRRVRPVLSDRVEQRFGRDLRIEHAQFFPEGEAAAGDRDAVVVVARDEKLGAFLGESAQDLEVRLHAQFLVGGGLDAETRDGVPLRVRLVVLTGRSRRSCRAGCFGWKATPDAPPVPGAGCAAS